MISAPTWPPRIHLTLAPGRKVVFRHCALDGPLYLRTLPGASAGQAEAERCVFRCAWGVPFWLSRGRTSVAARGSLFEAGEPLVTTWRGGVLGGWRGSRNVYRIGRHSWMDPPDAPLLSLDDWRRRWGSAEEGSVAVDPKLYDPRQWQLYANTPGTRATSDGRDIGADVRRVARTDK
jgi:hypothetical protein